MRDRAMDLEKHIQSLRTNKKMEEASKKESEAKRLAAEKNDLQAEVSAKSG
jgi:hypothetical protein